jgi:hypothetical protein
MLGTTVLYSSGDDGVAGGGGVCLNAKGKELFHSFPSASLTFPALQVDLQKVERSSTLISQLLAPS